MDIFKEEKILVTILILFSASIFLIGLGAMPLTDPDEVFYAETAKEMLKRNEPLTPYIFGKPQFEKPPLYYWLVLASFKIFGVNEFSARISSSLFGILGVVGMYLLGSILVNRRTGFFAALILMTCVEYMMLSRGCVTDIVLGVFILYAFLFFFYGYLRLNGRGVWYICSSLCLGLAVLTKGPVAILLPVAIVGLYLISTKELRRIGEIPLVKAGLLFLLISLPWYILMHQRHGKEFVDIFFGFHNVIRFLEPEHASGDVVWYYVPILLGGFIPWSIFLPSGIWQIMRERDERIKKANLFLCIWFFVIFVFFTISRTKLPTYIFPMFPVMALWTGRAWDVFLSGDSSPKLKKAMNISLFVFLATAVAGIIAFFVIAKEKYPTVTGTIFVPGTVFVLFIGLFVVSLFKKRLLISLVFFMTAFIFFVFPLSYKILPEVGRYEASKDVSEKLMELVRPGERIGAETQYRRGVAFYTDREDVIDVHPHHVITKFLDSRKRVWCIIKEKNHIQLYTDEKMPYKNPTYVMYKLGKKVIITNRKPVHGQVLKVRTINDPR